MKKVPEFTFTRERIMSGFDGETCKICPNLVITDKDIFLNYRKLLLTGSDVVVGGYFARSKDGGNTFLESEKFNHITTFENGIRTILSNVTEFYSAYHKKWFAFCKTISYEHNKHPIISGGIAIGEAKYIFKDCETGQYNCEPMDLPLPFEYISATPHSQIIEYENGEFLLTFYVVPKGETKAKVIAIRYRYENEKISIVKAGKLLEYPVAARGLDEPSIARLGNKYYVTLRTDEQGLLAISDDGLNFGEPFAWKWDDGSVLENYNTMQRWIRHKDALYLTYTRKGANNDHVFRHRAPIFMARFDEENLCLVKESEVILVPELGARLGNFTVSEISENEFWLITAEWMQPIGCEKYGSDNSIWIAKVKFQE